MSAAAADYSFTRMTQAELDQVCLKHERLMKGIPGGMRAKLAWCDLSGLSMKGRILKDADFTGAIMVDCDLTGAVLDGSNLYCVDIQLSCLKGASLRRVDLRGACLRGANLEGVDMFEADLREGAMAMPDKKTGLVYREISERASEAAYANLRGANLERSKLTGIQAMKADFTDAIMKSCNLSRANLKQAIMDNVDLEGANLSGADVSGASLKDAVLIGAKTDMWRVSQTDMTGVLTDKPVGQDITDLPYGNMLRQHALWVSTIGKEGTPSVFDKADLRGLKSIKGFNLAALSAKGAVFYGLDMRGIQLQGSQLDGADMRNCDLSGADLRGARMAKVRMDGANLEGAKLGALMIAKDRYMPADLSDGRMRNVNFTHADLRMAKLDGADISRSNLEGAQLKLEALENVTCMGLRGKIAE
ncbi:pentapeptide repeat-containing protein [Asticcacaulis sp. ZE23SCel15]|uniref:pentapeptide repeat-containing protein n=1 Tax=Asticcacaulis sp. ZE23SCel15 TaxID=3059027 RepID=UPI00265F94F7|nr:pentapeptide repeat-containing protein [Asticcacaulis sp. ZE23SCel15]WKL59063.1 pentapeptide repeat-containing protein [Asticcacaulis sp. ZE23SCel15]